MAETGYQLKGNAAQLYEQNNVPRLVRGQTEAMFDQVALHEGDRVLDVACGTGIVRIGNTNGILAPPPRKRNPREPPKTPLGFPPSPAGDDGCLSMQRRTATAARSKALRGLDRRLRMGEDRASRFYRGRRHRDHQFEEAGRGRQQV
jgi:hypothetical protein